VIGAATARPQDVRRESTRETPVVELDKAKRFYARRPVILYGGRLPDWAKAVAGDGYDFLKIKRVAEDHLLLRDDAGVDRRLLEAPVQLTGLFGFDKAEFDLILRAANWLGRAGNAPIAQLVEGDDTAAFAATLLTHAQASLRQQSTMATALSRQLADARQSNEDLQNRFSALEAFIDRHGLQPFECAFINQPAHEDGETASPAPNVLAMAANGRVAQILPVASLGISAIALHVAKAGPRSEATLTVTLASIEDGRTIESWIIPAAEMPVGWTTLTLRNAISGLRRTLRLVISADGARADLPLLSLGGAQPLDLFRLQDYDLQQTVTASSLALQVFVGLPGVAPPSPGGFAPQAGQHGKGSGLQECTVPPEILRNAVQVQLDSDTGGFEGVSYLDGERAISCHPPAFGMTIAKLTGGCPPGALRLSANLLVDHGQSKDVEFALVAGCNETRIMEMLSGIVDPIAGEGFSGWTRVPAKQPRFASLYMDAGGKTSCDLYLATRMLEPGNHDFAWARFLNLHALTQN
jgi:hypothetical protein